MTFLFMGIISSIHESLLHSTHVMVLNRYFLSDFSVAGKLVLIVVTMNHHFYNSIGVLVFVCSSHE